MVRRAGPVRPAGASAWPISTAPGTTDILYLASDGIQIYLNDAGNGWSEGRHLRRFPAVDDLSSVTVADLLGQRNGMPGLVIALARQCRTADALYRSHGRAEASSAESKAVNNLGAETGSNTHHRRSSTWRTRRPETPWITRLPFPVHVVERVETHDLISRNRFVTRYAYHHGFYDGVEREFRGFGMVEQFDTEELAALTRGRRLSRCHQYRRSPRTCPLC